MDSFPQPARAPAMAATAVPTKALRLDPLRAALMASLPAGPPRRGIPKPRAGAGPAPASA